MWFSFFFCVGLLIVGVLIVNAIDKKENKDPPKVRHYFMCSICHKEMTFDWNCGFTDGIWHCLYCNHVDGNPKVEITETENGTRFYKYVGEDE